MERFVLTSLESPSQSHKHIQDISLKSSICLIYKNLFFYHRQSGEGPEPETDAGRTEKGGSPCSEADRSRSQRNGEIGEIC